ncbi:Gfo/Idh/MocA family oxidoreductase [Streptomyces sp. NPDC094149]|uniref:Gfo/Idh/MocA family protein n=1 Tax=Streptomyces sp. NPDC094149 TaxID=3155079 RepID=UPI0033300E58
MTTLNVALIGAGFIARTHLAAWTALGAQVRIYSTDGQATSLAAEFGALPAPSLSQALQDADIADICTPTATHRQIALDAFHAGAHVVCEKPLALNTEDARAMTLAAKQAGRHLLPAHVVRYFPAYARARQTIREGGLGRIAVARFTRSGRYPTWSPWFADAALSGGILTDQMLHDIDIARWLFGDVVRIHAAQGGHHTALAHRSPVAAGSATLTHACGIISHVQGLWGPPSTQFRYTFHIAGSDGTLTHDSLAHPALRIDTSAQGETEGVPTGDWGEDPFLAQLRDFATTCTGGPAPRVSTEDGVAAVRLAEAARTSAATGRAIELTPHTAPLAEEIAP